MEKVDKLIEVALKKDGIICFFDIECLKLNSDELNYLIKQMIENGISINNESIEYIIKSKTFVSDTDLLLKESIKQYFKEVGQITILSECEEKLLFYEYNQNKSIELKQKIVSFYLRLVISIAVNYKHRIKNTHYDFLDIIQEGNKGLIRAVDKFDVTVGARFTVYASWWIRQAIEIELLENSQAIRLPVHLVEVYNKIQKYKKMCSTKNLTDVELAKVLGETEKRVKEAQKIVGRIVVSLDEYVCNSDDFSKLDYISLSEPTLEEIIVDNLEVEKIVETMRTVLSEKEFFVVSCKNGIINEVNKYCGEKTLTEVGKIMGLTRERVRQILNDAYKKIREVYENEPIKQKNKEK